MKITLRLLALVIALLAAAGLRGAETIPPAPARYFNDYARTVTAGVGNEGDAKRAAVSGFGRVFGNDGAAVGLDDFAADGQAEAGAFFAAGGFGREPAEVLEQLIALAVGDAGPLVLHGKLASAAADRELDRHGGAGGGSISPRC